MDWVDESWNAGTPWFSIADTWSWMRETSGQTTIVIPGRHIAGSW